MVHKCLWVLFLFFAFWAGPKISMALTEILYVAPKHFQHSHHIEKRKKATCVKGISVKKMKNNIEKNK